MEKWIRTRYQPNLPLDGERRVTACPEHIALSRQAAQEGMDQKYPVSNRHSPHSSHVKTILTWREQKLYTGF